MVEINNTMLGRETLVVRRSRNLRPVLDNHRARQTWADFIRITRLSEGKGELYVHWANGDWTKVEFMSYAVLKGFINRPIFYGVTVDKCE